MKILELPVPKRQHWLAKDLCIIIYNIERKQYPKLNDAEYITLLKKRLHQRYKEAKGTKTTVEILREYRRELK